MTDAVWIVPSYPWEEEPVGGIFHQTQARALARRGLEITAACPTPWAPWPLPRLRARWRRYAAAPPRAVDDGVRVIRPRYLGLPGEPSWAFPDRLVADATWRARGDWTGARLIHGHSAVAGLAAWRLARRTGLPFVITFHGSDLNTWPDDHPDRVRDLRAAAREARAVVTVSAALAARVRVLAGVEPVHLPLGSDHRSLAALAPPRDDARAAVGLADDRLVALFVGNLLVAKGLRELVDAVTPRGDRWVAVLVGDGPERGYGSDRERFPGTVWYRGRRSHDEIATWMRAADVLVLPSHREGLPTVLVEAGSLELPVIASGAGGIPGLLADGRGAVLPEVSAAAIGAALDAFALDPAAAAAAAAQLRRYVLVEHDVDVNAGRLLELYGLG